MPGGFLLPLPSPGSTRFFSLTPHPQCPWGPPTNLTTITPKLQLAVGPRIHFLKSKRNF